MAVLECPATGHLLGSANGLELRNWTPWKQTTTPVSPHDGVFWYNTSNGDKRIYFYDGQISAAVAVPRLDRNESWTGQPAFSFAGSPFTVVNSTRVNNLNTHKLADEGGVGRTGSSQHQDVSTVAIRDSGGRLRVATAVNDYDATPLIQVNDLIAGRIGAWTFCRVATTGNVDLANAPASVDGVTLSTNDRVLVWQQTIPVQNGIYLFTSGIPNTLSRAADADESDEFWNGRTAFVDLGTTYANKTFQCFNLVSGFVLGTNNVDFNIISGAGQITAGRGLVKTGDTLDVMQASDYTAGGILYASSTTALGHVQGTSGYFVRAGGTGVPTFLDLFNTVNTWGANQNVRSLIPTLDGSYTLGSSALRFNEVWGKDIRGGSATGTAAVFFAYMDGDTQARWGVRADGQMWAGSGSAATDCNLYRSTVNTWKTDDNLIVDLNLTVNGLTATTALYANASKVVTSVTANATATNKFLRQVSSGVPSFEQVGVGDLSGAAALTKVDDTNVTLTLGGTPATALLAATSMTVGWSGTLAVGRGGIGVGTLASNGVLYGNGTGAVQALAVNATATNKFLTQVSSGAPAWNTIAAGDLPGSFSGFANPTATIGLTTVNGTATTAMRSDAAPALSQAITPTWTGLHTFNSGTTPANVILLDIDALVADGTRDSHSVTFRGRGYASLAAHLAEWKMFVDVTAGSGASTFTLQSRIDAAAFANQVTITDAGNISSASYEATSYIKPNVTANYALITDVSQKISGVTGTQYKVLQMGVLAPYFSAVELAQAAATTGNLLTTRGGTAQDSSAWTGWVKVTAGAWSANATIPIGDISGNPVSGTGTSGKLVKWTGASSVGDSIVVESGTNIGIGTASPAALLHAKGPLSSALSGTVSVTAGTAAVTGVGTSFTTELAVGDSIKIGSEVFTVSVIASNTSLTLDSNHVAGASGATAYRDPTLLTLTNGDSVDKFLVTRSGNVGIGTASPGSKLVVYQDSQQDARIDFASNISKFKLFNNKTGLNHVDSMELQFTPVISGNPLAAVTSGWGASTNDGVLTFKVSADGGTTNPERMRIQSSGNVGIGTTGPLQKLQVNGNVLIADSAPVTYYPVTIKNADGSYGLHIFNSAESSTGLRFGTGGGGTTSRRGIVEAYRETVGSIPLVLQESGGNVGIGTTGPGYKLDVLNAARVFNNVGANSIANLYVSASKDGVGGASPEIYDIGGIRSQFPSSSWLSAKVSLLGPALTGYGSPLSYIDFVTDGTNRITSINGNVGIGTSSPTSALAFGGDAARTIQLEARTTNAAGSSLTVIAGAAGAGATGYAGGSLYLKGANAAGTTGAATGGDVYLQGGTGINGGAAGIIRADSHLAFASGYQCRLTDGTVGAPGLAFSAETSLGLWRTGAGALALASGGSSRLLVSSAGVVQIPNLTASKFVQTDASSNLVAANTIPGDASSYLMKGQWFNVGNGVDTSITLTHNYGTYDVGVQLVENSGDRKSVPVASIKRTTINDVVIEFATAPASNAYRALITATA